MTELTTASEKQPREELLPLVVEIIPGQAGEGLLAIFEPGSYENKPLADLCREMLARRDWSIEERQILDDIMRQLQGGILMAKGRDLQSQALDYARLEQSEEGENYFYAPVRAIKPQEGGVF
ncbi:MAG: hypothetical protein FJ135_12870 [Deltaproteobacteria bacterium]|nr:hypothetical protein [Deltaproteobacteria bacterium]